MRLTNLYLLVHHLRFDFTTHAETTLNLGLHLAAIRRQTVIRPATLIRRHVVLPTLVVKLEAPAAPRQLPRHTPTMASSMPITLPHGPMLVA